MLGTTLLQIRKLTLPAAMRLATPVKTVEEAEAGSGAAGGPTKTVSTSLPFLPVSLVRAAACTNLSHPARAANLQMVCSSIQKRFLQHERQHRDTM